MDSTLAILEPRDGDVLNRHDGSETADALTVTVRGTAPSAAQVKVNGRPAQRHGDTFTCDIQLSKQRNTITANAGNEKSEIEVFWNRGSRKRFRFSVDDNIQFLKDLGTNPDRFPSIFDHFFLKFWLEMHQKYGTKTHFNVYYQTDGFDLTQMPDQWRGEWQANADWLHITFHALQDKPDRPYRHAAYAQAAHDYDLVTGHIRRFAGDALIGNTTTVHWAEMPKDATRALRDRGISRLVALFNHVPCTTGYYLSDEQCAYCDTRGAWYDRDTDLTFIRCTAVVNALKTEEIPEYLDRRTATPQTQDILELLIHEQYFRKDIPDLYQPDIEEKVRVSLNWAAKNGYEPVFWSDGYLGTPE